MSELLTPLIGLDRAELAGVGPADDHQPGWIVAKPAALWPARALTII